MYKSFAVVVVTLLRLLVVYLSYSVHYSIVCVSHLSIEPLLTLPFTLEGDRWWITRTFDSGSIQQELDWPSCKPLFYHLSVRYVTHCCCSLLLVCVWKCFHCFHIGTLHGSRLSQGCLDWYDYLIYHQVEANSPNI